MSEVVSDMPSTRTGNDHVVEFLGAHFSVRARYQTSPGSRSPVRVLIGTPAIGVKTHACVDRFAVMHRRQTRPNCPGSEDTGLAHNWSSQMGQFFYSVTRMTARETVPAHALRLVNDEGLAAFAPRVEGHGEKPCRNMPLGADLEIGGETLQSTGSLPAYGQDQMD